MGWRSLDYVRSHYGLNLKRGDRVTVFGRPGRVTSGDAHYVRVRLDGDRHSFRVHPSDVHQVAEDG